MLKKWQNERDQVEMVWLEDFVPKEHLLRQIDAAVDFGKIYGKTERRSGRTGKNGTAAASLRFAVAQADSRRG